MSMPLAGPAQAVVAQSVEIAGAGLSAAMAKLAAHTRVLDQVEAAAAKANAALATCKAVVESSAAGVIAARGVLNDAQAAAAATAATAASAAAAQREGGGGVPSGTGGG